MARENASSSETYGPPRWWRMAVVGAWLGIAIAIVHPPHGMGVPLCLTRATLGVPCPGCGLTRSVSCTARGMFAQAWHYNPFGPLFLTSFIGVAFTSVLPLRRRSAVYRLLAEHRREINVAVAVFVVCFAGFGVVRAARAVRGGDHPPAFGAMFRTPASP